MTNRILSFVLIGLLGSAALAQTAEVKPTFIKGDIDIKYVTRTQTDSDGVPKDGVSDIYTFDVNVSDSSVFRGTINHRPHVKKTFGSNQTSNLVYALDCDIVNPANVAQRKNVGKFFGTVPIDENNVYRFAEGNLKSSIFSIGSAKGFESKFNGLALGKPIVQTGLIDKMKKEAMSIVKNGVKISVTNYDKMEFQSIVLASGPVSIYPEVTVNGVMIYDYGRAAWHLKGISVSYVRDNIRVQDTLNGDIRWVESPVRKTNGEGEYVFDIRVNEPAQSESAAFAAPSDESAFFAVDTVTPALVGSMKYKDSFIGDKVVSSKVKIDLNGNKLSKQQTMYLAKLLLFTAVVPLNAE